jgi:UTP--glucose-1-phosphate uridylyltransferase
MTEIKTVRKAVFPVAGLGTRFLPATKVLPKEMFPLHDRPVIQHAYEEAKEAGIEEFIFVSSPAKGILMDQVKSAGIAEDHVHETYQGQPLGLGHAVWCAKEFVGDEPFAVLLPDDVFISEKPCLSQMVDAYNVKGGNIISVMNVSKEDTSRYGVVDINSDDGKIVDVKGMVEKPSPDEAPSTLAVIGRYILQPEIFDHLENLGKGAGGEIQLTDAMEKLLAEQPFYGLRFDGVRYDCGTPLGYIEAGIAFSLNDPNISGDVRNILDKFSRIGIEEEEKSHVCSG